MNIYKITNLINNKFYIGKTIKPIQNRFLEHIKSSVKSKTILHKSIAKYGKDNFIIELIDSDIHSLDELNEKEKFYISKLNPEYNMTLGGDGGMCFNKLSEKSKNNIRNTFINRNKSLKGKTLEEIYGKEKSILIKEKISKSSKGKKMNLSIEERKRRSDQLKYNNPVKNGHSIESKIKISQTLKERNANVGVKNGMNTKPESRNKISEKNSKTYIMKNILTNEIFKVKNIGKWLTDRNIKIPNAKRKLSKNIPVENCIILESFYENRK